MSSFLHVTKLHNIYVNDVAYYYKTIFNCIILLCYTSHCTAYSL